MLLDAAIWVPNNLFRVGLARVRPDSESSGNPVTTLGGMLVCPGWQPNLVGTVTSLASTLANRFFFLKEPYGEISLCPLKSVGIFLFFLLIYFIYHLRGLGFLALILPLFLCAQKWEGPARRKKSACMWLRSSAKVLFCAFSKNGTAC